MFGSTLDVAIGLLLLFLVSSLMASAVVEAIGGLFHRRSKYLWDSLLLLLHPENPAAATSGSRSAVNIDTLYQSVGLASLVRPTDRHRFDPAGAVGSVAMTAAANPSAGSKRQAKMTKLPWREQLVQLAVQHWPLTIWFKAGTVGSSIQDDDNALLRRFYGPTDIAPATFAAALLSQFDVRAAVHRQLDQLRVQVRDDHLTGKAVGPFLQTVDTLAEALQLPDLTAEVKAARAMAGRGDELELIHLEQLLARLERVTTVASDSQLLRAAVDLDLTGLPAGLGAQLKALTLGTGGDDLPQAVQDWFERHMASATVWYRKQTRWFLFIVGLALAAAFNLDAIDATTTLYHDDALRAAVVDSAADVIGANCGPDATNTTDTTDRTDTDPAAGTTPTTTTATPADGETTSTTTTYTRCAEAVMAGAGTLPIGWERRPEWPQDLGAAALDLVGWVVVAGAATLGAPFWFDLLRRAFDVRAGKAGD